MSSSQQLSSASSEAQNEGLFPGFKHVEQFGPDEDYDNEEVEECYVTLDLGSIDHTLVPSSSSYRLIGLDTPSPLLQISRTTMKGHFRTLLGTELIFKDVSEETDPESSPTTGSSSKENIQYFTKTDRRIQFREVELKPKSNVSAQQERQQHALSQISLSSGKRKSSTLPLESLLAVPSPGASGEPGKHPDTLSGGGAVEGMGVDVGNVPQTDGSGAQTEGPTQTGDGNVGSQAMDVDP